MPAAVRSVLPEECVVSTIGGITHELGPPLTTAVRPHAATADEVSHLASFSYIFQ